MAADVAETSPGSGDRLSCWWLHFPTLCTEYNNTTLVQSNMGQSISSLFAFMWGGNKHVRILMVCTVCLLQLDLIRLLRLGSTLRVKQLFSTS